MRSGRVLPNTSLQRTHRQSLRSFLFAAELDIVRWREMRALPGVLRRIPWVVPALAGLAFWAAAAFFVELPRWDTFTLSMSVPDALRLFVQQGALYLLFAGTLQLGALLLAGVVFLPAWFSRPGRSRLLAFLQFNVLLLGWGALGNLAWVGIARDRLYVAYDPVVEWFAFLPYTKSVYDYRWGTHFGHLIGVGSDSLLLIIWALLALSTWSLTAASWLRLRSLRAAT
jgi:hypothetical protein